MRRSVQLSSMTNFVETSLWISPLTSTRWVLLRWTDCFFYHVICVLEWVYTRASTHVSEWIYDTVTWQFHLEFIKSCHNAINAKTKVFYNAWKQSCDSCCYVLCIACFSLFCSIYFLFCFWNFFSLKRFGHILLI